MQHDEFIKHVQSAAQLNTKEEAERATQATLTTLAERIVGNEASQLAAQLPPDVGQYLRGQEGQPGDRFNLQEFYRRVSEREGVEPQDAAIHTRAVFSVISTAVTPGEFADVRANFSPDYDELFAPQR